MYDVVIEPEPKHARHAQEILDRLQNHTEPRVFTPKAVYDGKAILFASHQLRLSGGAAGQFAVAMSDRPPPAGAVARRGVYNVKLSRAAAQTIDFSALTDLITERAVSSPRTLTAINLLQLLIRAAPNLMYPHNLRAYYTDAGKEQIGGGLELWRGFFQSVRPSIGRMLVNVDVSVSAMYEAGPLPDVALSVLGRLRNVRDLELAPGDANYRKLKSFFKNIFVRVNPTGGIPNARSPKKLIRDLVPYAGDFVFEKDGMSTTVEKHFQLAHGYHLRYPRIFGIRVGSKEKPIVFPAEVCVVVDGQLYKKKVPQELTPKVVKFATRRPKERLQTIEQGHGDRMQAPVLAYQSSPFLQDAGMQVAPSPIKINGRILPTPTLFFAGNQALNVDEGAWNIMRNQFRTPKPLIAWAVVDFAHSRTNYNSEQKATEFVQMLKNCFSSLGMKYLDPFMAKANDQADQAGHSKSLRNIAASTMDHAGQQAMQFPPAQRPPKPANVALIIAILPYPAPDIRRAVKHFGDVQEGIPTQCIRVDKLKSGNSLNQYCNNVALKINARLGGENSIARSRALSELQKAKFMIVGADVGHPGAGMPNQPSVASLVWSYDEHAVKYAAFSSVQQPRQEHIEELDLMMKRALDAFGGINNGPPVRIVFFRDGLSEGEFEGVGTIEIEAIQLAVDEIWNARGLTATKPKITYIIVGKRHHVRFFPSDAQGADRRSGNCKAGFVADNGLDSPMAADFYLQSHGGLLGTSCPSHYTVLRDDIFGKHPDALQQLAYTLCHCYAKATRSVSIPAPVYYADLVCARAKFHFDTHLGYDDTLTNSSGGAPFKLEPWKDGYRPLHDALKRSMYFL